MGYNNEEAEAPAPEPAVHPRRGRRADNPNQPRPRSNSIARMASSIFGKGQNNQPNSQRRPGLGLEHSNDSLTLIPYKKGTIDDGLEYGEYSPRTLARVHRNQKADLRELLMKTETTMRDARAVGSTAVATIEKLKQDPKIFAPVALSLSEISKLASTLAPGFVLAMKSAYPAAFALLSSPQFLVAGGMSAGVTVVMLGGYKIIRQLASCFSTGRPERPLAIEEPPTRGRRAIADRPRDASRGRRASQSRPRAAPDEIEQLQSSVSTIADWIPGFQAIGNLLGVGGNSDEKQPTQAEEVSERSEDEAPPPPPPRGRSSMRRTLSRGRAPDDPHDFERPAYCRGPSAGPPPQRNRSVGYARPPRQPTYPGPDAGYNDWDRPRPRPNRAYMDQSYATDMPPRPSRGRSRSGFRSVFGR